MSLSIYTQTKLDTFFSYMPEENFVENMKAKIAVEAALNKWTIKTGCAGFFYKIQQAFLAIFGCSDWQKAVKNLQVAIFKNISTASLKYTGINLGISAMPDSLKNIVSKIISKVLETGLIINKRDPASDKELTNDVAFQTSVTKVWTQFFQGLKGDLQALGQEPYLITLAFQLPNLINGALTHNHMTLNGCLNWLQNNGASPQQARYIQVALSQLGIR